MRVRRFPVLALLGILFCLFILSSFSVSPFSQAPETSLSATPLQSSTAFAAEERFNTQLSTVPVTVSANPLQTSQRCSGYFVEHKLSVATGVRVREITTYLSNGAGVAVNDLEEDGDLDLVFASVDRESTILWNQGALQFEPEALPDSFTRAVSTVDVNGDGLLDILFTHRNPQESVSYWRNQQVAYFVQQPLFVGALFVGDQPIINPLTSDGPTVDSYAYSMAWADLNEDGHLDLVTGSYHRELKQAGIEKPVLDGRAGLHYYEQQADSQADGQAAAGNPVRFIDYRISDQAEALSIGLLDLTGDGFADIWVANDFELPDQVWGRGLYGWKSLQPFVETSYSTMSIDWGDLANDGGLRLFTTDMNPYDRSPATLAQWLPMIDKLEQKVRADDTQWMANSLQVRSARQRWQNWAERDGVAASGWSWASRFGDLDNDGFLDLYVVNGMIAQNLFAHLPMGELVEENQAFRNRGDGSFVPAPTWRLGSTASGRGMVMADVDNDGDLDIVINTLRSQAQLFENQLCQGFGIELDLRWPSSPNTHAIGAQLLLETSKGSLQRDVRASGGYLSNDPTRIHFGVPKDTMIFQLSVRWPDGATSTVKAIQPQTRYVITRE